MKIFRIMKIYLKMLSIKKNKDIDDNIELLLNDNQLKSVKKDNSGSPDAEVKYNFEIIEGDYSKWR